MLRVNSATRNLAANAEFVETPGQIPPPHGRRDDSEFALFYKAGVRPFTTAPGKPARPRRTAYVTRIARARAACRRAMAALDRQNTHEGPLRIGDPPDGKVRTILASPHAAGAIILPGRAPGVLYLTQTGVVGWAT